MVCEEPRRRRQLVVSRRGSFFEDPFFRDAWDDYSSAVRSIVDRFNRGLVAPQRLPDSQCHSLYRTLRTARQNYSTHSARFKDEGHVYKLIMDVQEFIGGDITVRTAGGTVSVRGKVEVGGDERRKKASEDDDDTHSTVSGLSSSTKTLHRRFTLPSDADNEKVQSSLSKDAVLTITIPKKTGIHIIPVRLDDDQMEPGVARQPVGLKRPSDTQPDRHQKRSQDGVSSGSRKRRSKRDEERDKEEKRRNKRERNPRRESENEGDHPTKFRDAFRDSQQTETSRGADLKPADRHRRSRREKKYEEVREVNIPVRLLEDNTSQKKHQHQYEPKIRHIDIARDLKTSSDGHHRIDSEPKYRHQNGDKSERRKSDGILGDETYQSSRRRSYPEGTVDQVDGNNLKLKSEKRKEIKPIFELNDTDEEKNNQELGSPNKENVRIQKLEHEKLYKNKYQLGTEAPLITNDDKRTSTFDTPSIDIITNEDQKGINSSKSRLESEELDQANGTHDITKDSLETPKLSSRRPLSPVSPGSRLVKVEEDSSLKEDCMFKDCWNDFSNTLQDVLARLQELSSELGQFKALPTTPTSDSSFPEEEGQSFESSAEGRAPNPSSEPTRVLADGVSSPTSKATSAHSETSGVGVREGGPKDESGPVSSPWRAGHGPSVAYDLDARRKSDAPEGELLEDEITTVAPKERSPLVAGSSGQKGSNEVPQGVFPTRRPATLPLRDLARPWGEAPLQEDPPVFPAVGSLLENPESPGGLLETLRKNSPVEALQESFLRRSQPHAEGRGGRFVPVEVAGVGAGPVGGRGKGEERSRPPSPTESQSSAGSDWSESVSTAESDASENKVDLKGRIEPHEDDLNDLSRPQSLTNSVLDLEHRGLSYAPNIDASPESNLTSDEDDDEGSLPFPTQRPKKAPYPHVTPLPDVTASVGSANERRPEIPSDDDMGCERRLVPSARVPLVGAKRFSRANKPCDLLLDDDRGDAERGRESGGSMGAVFSRGRRGPSSTATDSPSGSPLGTRSPSTACPSSPGRRMRPQVPAPHQEKPTAVPSYVRTRVEAPKRSTGFSHVHSDNVRKMRDIWGTKQDSKVPGQVRPEKAPASPSRTTSRRSFDGPRSPRASESSSSRPHSVPYSERSSNSFKSTPSPSPSRGTSTSSPRSPASRYMKENSPARTNGHYSKPPSSPLCDSRRSSLANSKKGSAPPSPKCHRDSKESPLPSPMAEKKSRENSRFSFDKQRRDSYSKTAAHKDRRSPPVEESPRSSKVHQKIFKRLRDANLQPGSEAICFKEEADRYKMVMDVEEFVPGEIEVLQDDRLLTVKGRVETRNSTGQRIVRTFERTFDIPSNSREEDIDSALSKDGILIIFVPKKKERIIKIELVD